ncbi:excisionase [Amycolatopsis sp. WAC 01375]|uniref:helix-turn-helix domain-containing protein n=1 Tax=Amycolatopsis sp. WAC 01375 TaxID=2203194 RepID=UPI000F79180F|nr:excisionase [Amycolatopsis sp. WAC 01375]
MLSTDDLSRYLGVTKKTLAHWRQTRFGPPWVRMGKYVRYSPARVSDWLDDLHKDNDSW